MVAVKFGVSDVVGVGEVWWSVAETKLAGGAVSTRVLRSVRIVSENREIGREDPRFTLVAEALDAF